MIKDLYIRIPSDPSYNPSILDTSNEIEHIISKIKMILSTYPSTVLGDVSFGVGIEELVFQTNISSYKLEEMINKQIKEYVSEYSDYNISSAVSFGRTEDYDYCVIDIKLNGEPVAGILVN